MKDNFSKQAEGYAVHRPSYPSALFDFIMRHVQDKNTAWDCATGNGQAAKELAKHFNQVFATDISQQQLNNAATADNIIYSLQPAEQTIFADNTFDLITVSQALHWFRFDPFYAEAKRLARPNAILAVWAYSLLRITPAIDAIIDHYHFEMLKSYWDEERRYVDEEYKTIPFPFEELPVQAFEITVYWTLSDLEGYLNTWSVLQKFIAAEKYNPVIALIKEIKQNWVGERMIVTFPLHLKMARISSSLVP